MVKSSFKIIYTLVMNRYRSLTQYFNSGFGAEETNKTDQCCGHIGESDSNITDLVDTLFVI